MLMFPGVLCVLGEGRYVYSCGVCTCLWRAKGSFLITSHPFALPLDLDLMDSARLASQRVPTVYLSISTLSAGVKDADTAHAYIYQLSCLPTFCAIYFNGILSVTENLLLSFVPNLGIQIFIDRCYQSVVICIMLFKVSCSICFSLGPDKKGHQFSCVCLHGDRKPHERKQNLERFKVWGLVACISLLFKGADYSVPCFT